MKTAREEVARDAVEVTKVAKASLDQGEQVLAPKFLFDRKALIVKLYYLKHVPEGPDAKKPPTAIAAHVYN